jgi:hypothetical protein
LKTAALGATVGTRESGKKKEQKIENASKKTCKIPSFLQKLCTWNRFCDAITGQ